MDGLSNIVLMSAVLGSSAFFIGMIPIYFTISKTRLHMLSIVGNGLLLGTALGVVIPEGIEALITTLDEAELVTSRVALAILSGFAFMLVTERVIVSHSHSHSKSNTMYMRLAQVSPHAATQGSLGDAESFPGVIPDTERALDNAEEGLGHYHTFVDESSKAFPFTLGLVFHSLADGLALGASSFHRDIDDNGQKFDLSLVVFMSLVIHKAPAALALTTSLLSTSLPRSDCRKHLLFFSLSTPLGALMSFGILAFMGTGEEGDWPGIALLVSGGTFLYVATVLQPISSHRARSDISNEKLHAVIIGLSMFLPFVVSQALGHGH